MIEQDVQNKIRVAASTVGTRLFRNNVGALYNARGALVRYGLGNESKTVNDKMKSSDLIGITPVTITNSHVGCTFGVFTSIEVKETGWVYRNNNKRESAQLAWIDLIKAFGGKAGFAQSIDDMIGIIRG